MTASGGDVTDTWLGRAIRDAAAGAAREVAADAKAAQSKRGRANRRKGGDTERAVVNYLKANGYPDARRYLAGDGRQPGDIDFHPLVVLEVKDVKSSAWPSWCRQAAAAAGAGQVPVVVRRTHGNPDVAQWECRVKTYPWVKLNGVCFQRLGAGSAAVWCGGRIVGNIALLRSGVTCTLNDLRYDDGSRWLKFTFAEFVAALRRFDTLDGA